MKNMAAVFFTGQKYKTAGQFPAAHYFLTWVNAA
jgi:hypothetical protein